MRVYGGLEVSASRTFFAPAGAGLCGTEKKNRARAFFFSAKRMLHFVEKSVKIFIRLWSDK